MIETKDVQVTLSKKVIVDNANIKACDGEFVGIVGPNGSGKSTLLKSIYRLLKPSGGAVYINNVPLEDMTLNESALEMAVVAQHNYYNFDFSVFDVVLMGRTPHKKTMEFDNDDDRDIAIESLKTVGMYEYKDRSFYSLSGGEQQRVILARALAQDTPCLILDEPTNHLDIKYQLHLLEVVKNLHRTSLCALHDLNLAATYCDKVYVMFEGHVYREGTPEEVLTEKLIKEVYGVNSYVDVHSKTGKLNIVYTSEDY